jgi:hypothetical protein
MWERFSLLTIAKQSLRGLLPDAGEWQRVGPWPGAKGFWHDCGLGGQFSVRLLETIRLREKGKDIVYIYKSNLSYYVAQTS